jgi:hypothetical protein
MLSTIPTLAAGRRDRYEYRRDYFLPDGKSQECTTCSEV